MVMMQNGEYLLNQEQQDNRVDLNLKKKIELVKEESEKKLISQKLFESRIFALTNGRNIKDILPTLNENQRIIFSVRLLEEIVQAQDNKYLNEQLGDYFKGFSNLIGLGIDSTIETIVESALMGIFTWLGIEKWWLSRQITSIIASDPRRLIKAIKGDCNEITKLIAESTVEAMVMGYQQEHKSVSGPFSDFFRNAIGNWLQDSDMVKNIENLLSDKVCSLFGNVKKTLSAATGT